MIPVTTTTSSAPPPRPTVTVVSKPGFTAAPIYLVGVDGPKSIAPNTIYLSGDGSVFVQKVNWTSWTTTRATGNGVMLIDDCVPDCARGHASPLPVAIALSNPVTTTSCGQIWGSEAFVFTGAGPAEDLTPPVVHRNGHVEWDLTPNLANNRC